MYCISLLVLYGQGITFWNNNYQERVSLYFVKSRKRFANFYRFEVSFSNMAVETKLWQFNVIRL